MRLMSKLKALWVSAETKRKVEMARGALESACGFRLNHDDVVALVFEQTDMGSVAKVVAERKARASRSSETVRMTESGSPVEEARTP